MVTILRTILFSLFLFLFIVPAVSFAQTPPPKDEFYKAEVTKIVATGEKYVEEGKNQPYQVVKVKFLDGANQGKEITIDYGDATTIREDQKVAVGEKIVLLKVTTPKGSEYQIIDRYRLDNLIPLVIFFFVLVIGLSRWKGFGSIVGLIVSLLVILKFIVPQILAGNNPLVVSIIGSIFIMGVTIYLAHGFSRKTHIALFSTSVSLVLTGLLAYFFVDFVHLTGLGNDDANALRFGALETIDFRGLLLGGIIIGALGVLDDITTSLSAVIEELKIANPTYSFSHLVKSGFRVGSEHISSLVNTLVLAYAGTGLPLFLFLILNPLQNPLWVILNSEIIVEEIIRTLAGSIGIIMAVPITTVVASWIVTRHVEKKKVVGAKA